MIGQTVSHYRILEKLGEGGMGVVYKAEDTKLGRDVALKFLPANVSSSRDEIARFEQEAKAISALNHPNIATIYDVDEANGQKFLALEYISGGTLKAKIKQMKSERREIPIADIVDYGIQMAEGLGHAHHEGIIHRDVKSDNMMLTKEGKVKITDFGLAKLHGSSQITRAGSTVGTAAYMSPEQMRGEEVDARSDLFSLGVVLYELTTLQMPFRGEHEAALAYSIVNEEPQEIGTVRSAVPPILVVIIKKCLKKETTKRYQRAEQIAADLLALQQDSSGNLTTVVQQSKLPWMIATGIVLLAAIGLYFFLPTAHQTEANVKTIAVLPFTNMSGDQQDEYFSDGMTEDILTHLSKIADLKVISRTSVMQYKGTKKTIREIGKELNAGVVLEGSVRRAGNQVRITAQLINANTDEHLWAEAYDKEFKDIFSIQSDVAQKIAGALQANLSPSEKNRIEKVPTTNTEAYNVYLKGIFFIRKITPDDVAKGLALLNEAIKLDSNFALPYTGIAYYYALVTDFYLAPAVAMPEVKKAASRALEIDNELSQAHAWHGFYYYWYGWNWEAAGRELQKAVDLGPGDYTAHLNYGWYFLSQGKLKEADDEGKKYLDLEPTSPEENAFYGQNLYYARRYDEAFAQLQKALDLDPDYPFTRLFLGWCYLQQGRYPEAIVQCKKSHEVAACPWSLARLGYAYAIAGQRKDALMVLDTLSEQSKRLYVPSDVVASVYVGLGDKNRAFDYLEKAYEERAGWMTFLKVDPIWDPIRADARFIQLLKKMELDK